MKALGKVTGPETAKASQDCNDPPGYTTQTRGITQGSPLAEASPCTETGDRVGRGQSRVPLHSQGASSPSAVSATSSSESQCRSGVDSAGAPSASSQ